MYEATYSCILHFAPFVTQKKSRRSKPQSSASAHLGFLRAVACWRQVGAAFFFKMRVSLFDWTSRPPQLPSVGKDRLSLPLSFDTNALASWLLVCVSHFCQLAFMPGTIWTSLSATSQDLTHGSAWQSCWGHKKTFASLERESAPWIQKFLAYTLPSPSEVSSNRMSSGIGGESLCQNKHHRCFLGTCSLGNKSPDIKQIDSEKN